MRFLVAILLCLFSCAFISSKNPQPTQQENNALQKLIPLFAKKMNCQIGNNKIQKWDIQKNQSKFSIAWKHQCGPVINSIYQMGDNGHGSTFVCQNKNGKTCCWPLGYHYVNAFVVCR